MGWGDERCSGFQVFEGFFGFATRSVFLGLGGHVFGVRLVAVGFCGCLTDSPCRSIGVFSPGSVFVFHFASLMKPDFDLGLTC